MEAFILAMLAGVLVCAPPGPLGALCARTSALHGRAAGLGVGLAIACGEAVHASLASLGALDPHEIPRTLRLVLGLALALLLLGLAWRTWRRAEGQETAPRASRKGALGVFLLALATPGTLPAYVLIFTAFGLRGAAAPWLLAGGAVAGSLCWWGFVVSMAHRLRGRLASSPVVLARACGALFLLGAFGALRAAVG
jgi:threonine/homoserine/homoserine lactone efflux protein